MTTERFHFKHEDKDYTFPYLTNLKAGLKADVMEGFSEIETAPHKIYKAIFSVALIEGKATEAAVRDMDDEQFNDLVSGWMKSTPGVSGK